MGPTAPCRPQPRGKQLVTATITGIQCEDDKTSYARGVFWLLYCMYSSPELAVGIQQESSHHSCVDAGEESMIEFNLFGFKEFHPVSGWLTACQTWNHLSANRQNRN